MTKIYTVDDIIGLHPCDDYTRYDVNVLIGQGMTAAQIADVTDIST